MHFAMGRSPQGLFQVRMRLVHVEQAGLLGQLSLVWLDLRRPSYDGKPRSRFVSGDLGSN